jgi:asparagine N-glycosylation enzyme membrane subunit Stt3
MWHMVLFNILMLAASTYALGWGGAPERLFTLMTIVALYATIHIHHDGFRKLDVGLFLVDLAFFAALYLLSLFSTRFWPIWMSGLQGLTVLSHAAILAPTPSGFGYAVLEQVWAWPMEILLIVATFRHRRRLAWSGTDRPWTLSFARSAPPNPR